MDCEGISGGNERDAQGNCYSEELSLMKISNREATQSGLHEGVLHRHSAEFRRHWAASIFCDIRVHLGDQLGGFLSC